ncbi:MAG: 4'-phosphopantetheinyl transferase family protein [Thiogranum sp.]
MLEQLQHEAHVWLVVPESVQNPDELERFRSILSDDELARYWRFHFQEDRHRYLISHAMVREVLSSYTGLAPSEWHFTQSEHGRPEIANSDAADIRFNLTHTRGLAACIVTRGCECGIDTEQLDARRHLTDIAQRMFSAEEHLQLKQLTDTALIEAFFTRWTLREAFVKAKGIGISYPTRKLHFDITDDDTIRVRFDAGLDEDAGQWQFRLLRPTADHIAATALRTDGQAEYRIVQHHFEG